MKNQLRKATLRAAAVAMSATIAASSMPLTALAQDDTTGQGGNGNDGNKSSQEQQQPTAEQNVQSDENSAATAIDNANNAAIKIAPEKSLVTETAYDDIIETQKATNKAVEDEKKVTTNVNTLVNSETTKEELNEDVKNLNKIVSDANQIVTDDATNIEKVNNDLADAQKKIEEQKTKEDAEEIYKAALSKEEDAQKAHDTAKTNLANKNNEYEKAKKALDEKYKAYEALVDAGVTDLVAVEDDLKTANDNLVKLQEEVTGLENDLTKAEEALKKSKEEYAKSAAKKLYDEYNASDADKKIIFEEILKDYYMNSIEKDAKDIEVGDYDKENNLYPVNYTVNNETKTIYVSYDYTENGIVITKKDKNLESDAVEEQYKCNGNAISADYYNSLKGKTLTESEIEKLSIDKIDYNEPFFVEGQNNVSKIDNEKYVIGENGIVTVKGDVTTIIKTKNSLIAAPADSTITFTDKEQAKKAASALCDDYNSKDGYEDVKYTLEESYAATVFYVPVDTFTTLNPFQLITGYHPFVGDYVYDAKLTWQGIKVTYADVGKTTVPYTTGDGIKEDLEAIAGKEQIKRISLKKSVEDGLYFENTSKNEGGYVVAFNWVNLDSKTADVYYVKGQRIVGKGTTEKEAKEELDKQLKNKNYSGVRNEGLTTYYTIKLTGTKIETPTKNEVIKTSEASVLEHIDAKKAVFSYSDGETYKNNFISTAKTDAGKIESDETTLSGQRTVVGEYRKQVDAAKGAVEKAQNKVTTLKTNLTNLQTDAKEIKSKIDEIDGKMNKITLGEYTLDTKNIDNAYNKLPNKKTESSSNNGNNNNNNNTNNPTPAVLPVAPVRPVTPAQQIVELTEDQTPLTATPDTTTDAAKKPGKKVKTTNTKATTDDKDAKKPGNNKPKKVTPEVEDDTMEEDDLEIISLDDDSDKVPLAPGVAADSTDKDIMDETSQVSWLWLIILAVASVVTFGTYKGVKKHNENKGKNNR